jgi:hypothetical protein
MEGWSDTKAREWLDGMLIMNAVYLIAKEEEVRASLAAKLREVRDECVCSACGSVAIHRSEQ